MSTNEYESREEYETRMKKHAMKLDRKRLKTYLESMKESLEDILDEWDDYSQHFKDAFANFMFYKSKSNDNNIYYFVCNYCPTEEL